MSYLDTMSLTQLLDELRGSGWAVICHNDYMQTQPQHEIVEGGPYGLSSVSVTHTSKVKMTFWSFGHECGIFIKADGFTDIEAVRACALQAQAVFSPSP